MAKDTFYFSHDYNTRTDIKIKKLIQKHGYKGYGIFWAIVEDLYNNANALPADYESIAYDLREDQEIVKSIIIDFDLFFIENNVISSESVERRLILRDAKTDKARAAALARWEKEREKKRLKDANASNKDANALQTECKSNAIKEIKEKEIKENNIKKTNFKNPLTFSQIIDELKKESNQKNIILAQYKTTSKTLDSYIDFFNCNYMPEDESEVFELSEKRTHFKNFLKNNWNKIPQSQQQQTSNKPIIIPPK